MKIGFIGCGNMAGAIIKAIAKKGEAKIYAYDIDVEKTRELSETLGINQAISPEELLEQCETIVMAVKPNLMKEVLESIKENLNEKRHVLVSIAAGISLNMLYDFAGVQKLPIVRVMPNINISVGQGMAAICRNEYTKDESHKQIIHMFEMGGKVMELSEKFFPLFAALAGSSPAFSYLFIDSLAKAAHKSGMPKDKALEIAAQAVLGSAAVILESGLHPWQLIDSVCSPGGTTIEGICSLEESGFQAAIVKCLDICMLKDAVIAKGNK